MFEYPKAMVAAIGLIGCSAAAFAGDFDGSTPLSGTVGKVIEIKRYRLSDDVDPDTVGLPKKFLIDLRRQILIHRVAFVENKTVIQGVDEGVEGVDDGLAWSLTISKKDGGAVLSASGNGVAYVVFGVCTPIKANP